MLTSKKVLIFSFAYSTILILSFIIYSHFSQANDIVYINNSKLFEGFIMTKEIKKLGEKEVQIRSKIIDSLQQQLNNPSNKIPVNILMSQLVQEREALDKFNIEYSSTESQKIWSRISAYAIEFSQERNYKIILGAQPNTNLIYGDKGKEVTSEFLTFINNKYEGLK